MLLKKGKLPELINAIQALDLAEQETVLLLFGEKTDIDFSKMILSLKELRISFFGGVFPGIIYDAQNLTEGCVIIPLRTIVPPMLISLDDIPDLTLFQQKNLANQGTILTFVDGLNPNISNYLQALFDQVGSSVNLIGGGAGSLSLVQQPCVFTSEGIFQDKAVICTLAQRSSLGVRHGWERLAGPIVATHTQKNKIRELNWQNAFEVYQEALSEELEAGVLTRDNFFEIAKSYPFGIYKEGSEVIVRDPIAVGEKGELICVGEVPDNTVLYILKGEKKKLIESAKMAVSDSIDSVEGTIQQTLVIDCISRTLFLEHDFDKELQAICDSLPSTMSKVPKGVLSLGEISSYDNGFLEFYNKTLVIGTLYD